MGVSWAHSVVLQFCSSSSESILCWAFSNSVIHCMMLCASYSSVTLVCVCKIYYYTLYTCYTAVILYFCSWMGMLRSVCSIIHMWVYYIWYIITLDCGNLYGSAMASKSYYVSQVSILVSYQLRLALWRWDISGNTTITCLPSTSGLSLNVPRIFPAVYGNRLWLKSLPVSCGTTCLRVL